MEAEDFRRGERGDEGKADHVGTGAWQHERIEGGGGGIGLLRGGLRVRLSVAGVLRGALGRGLRRLRAGLGRAGRCLHLFERDLPGCADQRRARHALGHAILEHHEGLAAIGFGDERELRDFRHVSPPHSRAAAGRSR
jgi:hypothetical protein